MNPVSIPWADYGNSRLDVDEQRIVNMYPATDGGLRQFPALVEFAAPTAHRKFAVLSRDGVNAKLSAYETTGASYSALGSATNVGTIGTTYQAATGDICDLGGGLVALTYYNPTDSTWYIESWQFDGSTWTQKSISTAITTTSRDRVRVTRLANRKVLVMMEDDVNSFFQVFQMQDDGTIAAVSSQTTWAATTGTLYDVAGLSADRFVLLSESSTPLATFQTYAITGDTIAAEGTAFTLTPEAFGDKVRIARMREDRLFVYIDLDGATTAEIRAYEYDETAQTWSRLGTDYEIVAGSIGTDDRLIGIGDTTSLVLKETTSGNFNVGEDVFDDSTNTWTNGQSMAAQALTDVDGAASISAADSIAMAGRLLGDLVYIFSSSDVWSVNSDGTVVAIADDQKPPLSNYVIDTDGTQIVAAGGDEKKVYTVAGGLVDITDVDLLDAYSTAHLNSRFYFDQPSSQFSASALNDATSVETLDTATAESLDSIILRSLCVDQLLYHFGKTGIDIWYGSGVGRPPVDRQDVIDEIGIIGRRALAVLDNVIYFVDNKRRLFRMMGTSYELLPLSAEVYTQWSKYRIADDCSVSTLVIEGETMVQIAFPSEGKTWVYHVPTGKAVERELLGTAYPSYAYVQAFGKNIALGRGPVYELDSDIYQDRGLDVKRVAHTSLITSERFGAPGRHLILNGLYLTVEASGAGSLNVEIARDGGAFETARSISVTSGVNRYQLRQFGRFREAIFRLTTSSNIKLDFVGTPEIEVEALNV